MKDLFDNRPSKIKLLEWLRQKKYAKTSEIIMWGVQNYTNRADRNARQLAQEKHLRRMTDEERYYHYGRIKEEAWIAI